MPASPEIPAELCAWKVALQKLYDECSERPAEVNTNLLWIKVQQQAERIADLERQTSPDLKSALLALDLKPNTIIFFDRIAIDSKGLSDIELDLDCAPLCIPVHVPEGKMLHECVMGLDDSIFQLGYNAGQKFERNRVAVERDALSSHWSSR